VFGEPPDEAERAGRDRLHQGMFIDMDPPEHDAYRRMVISEFSVRRIAAMRPGIQRTVDGALDALVAAGPPADLVAGFGLPVPSLVICQLLGVPYEDRQYFQSRTRLTTELNTDPAAGRAFLEIREYLDGLVSRAEREPGDDLIGRLVTGPLAAGALEHDALVGMAFLMLVAGFETTANMIPLAALTLLEHPAALAELRADPALWPGAVEELLRYHSIVDWIAFDRMALRDLEIGGQRVRAGEGVYVLGAAANRDPRAFERPDEFDIHRGARHHVAFGYGVHQCLGQNLARAELEIALRTLFERLPELRLASDVDSLPVKYDAPIFGLYELPVAW
jgi:cytochrome P450